MKPLVYVFCLIFGHNKVLESRKEGRFTIHYTSCTQCERKWFTKKLGTIPKITFKKHEIKIRAQGQKIIINSAQHKIINKKLKVNFYAL